MDYNISGRITEVSEKEWYDSKNDVDILLYSFQVKGEKRWFRTGENSIPFEEGDNVEFTFDTKSGNVDIDTLKKASAKSKASSKGRGSSSRGSGGSARGNSRSTNARGGTTTRDDYWANKEANDKIKDERYQTVDVPRMSFSASQERAVVLVSAALAADALAFGSTSKGKKLDMMLDYVDLVTDRFFAQAMGAGEHYKNLEIDAANTITDSDNDLSEDDEEYDYDD